MLTNLKKLRAEKNISQQRLAEEIGVTQQSVHQYETHGTEPDIGCLVRIAQYFDTSIDYIVGHTEIRRRIEETSPFDLNEEEAQLIAQYRALTPKERDCIRLMANTLLHKDE